MLVTSTYQYPGFGLQVCSTSIPPAAGAPYTAVDDHETPRAQCSANRQDQAFRLEYDYSLSLRVAPHTAKQLDCWAKCKRAPLIHSLRHTEVVSLGKGQEVEIHREFHLHPYPSYICEENDPLPMSYMWSMRCSNRDIPPKNRGSHIHLNWFKDPMKWTSELQWCPYTALVGITELWNPAQFSKKTFYLHKNQTFFISTLSHIGWPISTGNTAR